MKNKSFISRTLHDSISVLIAALFSFVSLHVFVLPADFSPSGIDGISTILYEITTINPGWFKILFAVPLFLLAWKRLKKRYVILVALFTILDSLGLIALESIHFYTFIPDGLSAAEAIGFRLLGAVFAGVALGVCTAIMLRLGASGGGVDIIASLITQKKPHIHVEKIISFICYIIILCSYFVYWDVVSILLSAVQIFVFEATTSAILRRDRYGVEIKLYTKDPLAVLPYLSAVSVASPIALRGEDADGQPLFCLLSVVPSQKLTSFMQNIQHLSDTTFLTVSEGARFLTEQEKQSGV